MIKYIQYIVRGVSVLKTGFIGVGNMGGAILRSFAASDNIDTGSLYIYSRTVSKTEALARELGVKTCGSAAELAKACDIIIIGVKPDTVASVMEQIAPVYTPDKIIISMAAGISIRAIEDMAGVSAKVIRIMPNTSGSSPAYTYMYIDALAQAAQTEGMSRGQAVEFAAQSVLGAAKMVLETGQPPQQLRDNVCSPGGTTIEAVKTLQQNGFADRLTEGFNACVRKSEDMSR